MNPSRIWNTRKYSDFGSGAGRYALRLPSFLEHIYRPWKVTQAVNRYTGYGYRVVVTIQVYPTKELIKRQRQVLRKHEHASNIRVTPDETTPNTTPH